jgi:ABC-2 type transport system ATP-binding protein
MIEFRNVSKKFGKKKAVDNISFKIKEGEIFTLLGPNGAGKTTTMKLMAGLLLPDEGEILLNGRKKEYKDFLGYIPDEPFIYPELSGREFIYFVARLYKMKKNEIDERFEKLCNRFEVGEWIDMPSSTYSHGMKQRVVFIQSLIHNPRIIIIDEPHVGLDPKGSKIVNELMIECAKNGASVVLSTHSLHLAEELSDRICLINNGKLLGIFDVHKISEEGYKNVEELYFRITSEVF